MGRDFVPEYPSTHYHGILGMPIVREYTFEQEAHGPRFAHLSDIATADMQMLCNIFPILSSQLMKISSFEQFLVLKKNIWGLTVNGAWSFE